MRLAIVFALFISLLLAAAGAAELNRYLSELKALRADFSQTVYDEQDQPIQQASGQMAMQRPGKFRWDYTQPYEQTIVADGERLWLYDKDLEQVTVRRLADARSTAPLAVLSGAALVEDAFSVTENYRRDGINWYELEPLDADASEFNQLKLGFAERQLNIIELVDNFQRRTRLTLNRLERNPELEAELFRFEPPPGVDVVGD